MTIRVTPGASQNKITGFYRDSNDKMSLKVLTTTQPEKGKANKAVIKTLSKKFKRPKSFFKIKSGHTGRQKTVLLANNDHDFENWFLPILEEIKNDQRQKN